VGTDFKPLKMLSHKNGIVALYILFTLLYSIASVKRKDSGWKQLKASLNAKAVNLSDGAAKVFLTNLYKNYFNETGQVKRTNTTIPEIIHSVQGTVCVKTNVIRFNMKGINAKEYIQKAEIRAKVEYSTDQDQNASHPVKLGLYDKTAGVLISKAVLHGRDPTWTVFMVPSADVARWLRSPHTIPEVRVEVLADSDKQKPVPKVLMHGGSSGPFLVVYTDARRLHGVEDSPFIRDRFRRDSKANTNKTAAIPSPSPTDLCSRRDLHINAKHIFGNLIIAPVSFNAYDCAGKCDATYSPGSFSNHAIVRLTAAQHWGPGSHMTAPCCVPTNYGSLLGVLYTTQDGHVVLRQYKDMVATECGCR